MNIIITSTGQSITTAFDKRFARAEYFCVYNTDDKTTLFIQNTSKDESTCIGDKVVAKIVELKARKVISGDFGSRVKELLDKANVQMIILPDTEETITQIINKIK